MCLRHLILTLIFTPDPMFHYFCTNSTLLPLPQTSGFEDVSICCVLNGDEFLGYTDLFHLLICQPSCFVVSVSDCRHA